VAEKVLDTLGLWVIPQFKNAKDPIGGVQVPGPSRTAGDDRIVVISMEGSDREKTTSR